ncbi:MAG: uracil-DNA glycosylase, partial [Polyangiaceae bacterium]
MNEKDELLELATALRAHAEWQLATGVTGSPASELRARAPRGGATAPAVRAPASAQGVQGVGAPSVGAQGGAARSPSPAPAAAPAITSPAEPLSPEREAARVRLVALADEIKSCTKCALYAGRTQTVFARGNTAAELCFVGEGPGADEDAEGFPFVGKAGQLLDRMIAAMGYARDDVYICNIVKCRPPNNRKPEPDEMSQCTPYLREQLELVSPKAIVALGATAVEGLLGAGGGITRLRGQWKLYRAIPVMPTFHPAYLLRNPEAKREVWAD